MTARHPVRRLLARVCSPATMAHVVDPVLADMRVEDGRLTWRGGLVLTRALTMHTIVSTPGALARLWSDDDRAVPRAIAACALATAVLAAPLVAIPARSALHISWRAVILLAPQALAMALPMSLLVAIPVAFRRSADAQRVLARGLSLAACCAVATSFVMIQLLPDANQAFRVEVVKRIDPTLVHLQPGPLEMTLHELRDQVHVLRLTPGGTVAARRFEYVFQMKLALSTIPLPLGLLAIAITITARGRARSIAIGMGSAVVYVWGAFALDSWTVRLLQRSDAVSAGVLAWLPTVLIAALAAALFWRSRLRMPSPCL
jgi:hypothetical protein